MSLWFKVRGMMGDDPPYLAVGTEVSAKYKGAFCEAKVRKVVRSVKCKVTFKQGLGTVTVTDDHIRGTLRVGAVCEVKHPEKKEIIEATISKIQDCSQYTVVFDDGDITTLRRSALCLKSGRHFAESETLDQLPLTHPEHFGNPVIGGRKGRRSRQTQDDSSDDESLPKKGKKKEEKEADIGKVVCVELGDKKKQKDNWFPGLVVAPTAQDTVRIRVKDEYLVRSFKDGRYFTVPKKEATSFTREIGSKVDNNTLKTAVEKALQYLDRDDLPPHWDRDLLFGIAESSANSDGLDSDSSDDEPREEKDHFVAQLYKFMDDRGTPINKGPTIGTRDVDLYKLFKVVDKLGGYNRVTNHNQWKTISHKLGFGQNSSSITNLVKQAYKKFLHSFEDFYRKLGCTMVNHPRGDRSRHRSGRSLIRDRDRATPVNTLKDKDKDKQAPTTSGEQQQQGEGAVEKKEPEEEKKDKQEDAAAKPKEVKKEKVKVKEEKVEATAREERKNERLKTKEETQASPASEKQKKKDEKPSKAVEVLKEKAEERDDKKVKKEEKVKDKEPKGKAAGDDSAEVETESKAKYKAKKEDKSKSASERTRSKDEERLKAAADDKRVAEDRGGKPADEKAKSEEKKPAEERGKVSEGKAKTTEAKKKLVEARSKKAAEEKGKQKPPDQNAKEPKPKTETKGKVAPDDRSKASDAKPKTPEDRAKVSSEPKTRASEEKGKPQQDEKPGQAEPKGKGGEEKKAAEDKAKQPEAKAKAPEAKPKDAKAEPKPKPVEPKGEERAKGGGDEKQKPPAGSSEELDSSSEKDGCDRRADGDKQFTRSRSKEDQRLKKEQTADQRSRNRESKTPVRETAEKKPPPRKKEEMVFVLKKRGRKRKDTETKIEEGLGQIASNVNIDIGDKLKVYYGPTQESKVTYEAKASKQSSSSGRRGRPSRDSAPPPARPRSATPSSVTSSSSRTKSPAGSNHGKNQGGSSSRGGRGRALFRRRTRRTSGHTDISLASESDTEDFESEVEAEAEPEVELSRLRSGNEKRHSATEKEGRTKEDQKASSSSNQEEEEELEEEEDESTELDTSGEALAFETRRSTRSTRSLGEKKEVKQQHHYESDEDQPKGRDFDLNEIRSELKGIEKAVKVPPKADAKSPEPKEEEEEAVEDVYEFKEPEPFEFEVRPKKDFDDRSPKAPRRRVFEDHGSSTTSSSSSAAVAEKDEAKPLKRGACQLFDSDDMSEDRTDSDTAEGEVRSKFVKRFALAVCDDAEGKTCKADPEEAPGECGKLPEEKAVELKEVTTTAATAAATAFGKRSPKADEARPKSGQESLIFEDLKYETGPEKKEEPEDAQEKPAGGIFEDEAPGQPVDGDDEEEQLVVECDRDVKLFQDEEMKTETVLAEVVVEGPPQPLDGAGSPGGVRKAPGAPGEGEEEAPAKPQTKEGARKPARKVQDGGKSPRKKFADARTPDRKARRPAPKKAEEPSATPSRSRPLSACEEAFDKLCESPSFRLVSSKRSPTPAELEPLGIFAGGGRGEEDEDDDEEEDRLIIPEDMAIGEPLFSYPRELFPALVEPQKKVEAAVTTPGEFHFSEGEKEARHRTVEEAQSDKVTRKLDFGSAVKGMDDVTPDEEVGTEAEAKEPVKDVCALEEATAGKEPEELCVPATVLEPTQQQVTQQQQPVPDATEVDVFGKRPVKREAAPPQPVRFSGTDSSDTDSSDEGPRLVIAPPEEEEFSQLTPSQEEEEEELQETVVDEISAASEIVLEEIKVVGPLVAEVEEEEQVQQEVEVEVVDESQDRVKLTDEEEEEETVAEELETVVPIVVKVDLSSAEKVETSESEQGPVVELKISEEETTVCVVETTEAAECEVLGSLLCQETIPGSPAAAPQPAAEEAAPAAAPAVEMPFASAPGSSPGPRPPPEPAAAAPPAPGASSGGGKGHAAPVLDNTPPTTPDSSVSTLSDERGGMSPTLDNESSKSHRDSFEIDLDSCVESAKVDHFSEDDSLVNVEVSCSSDTRLRTQKPPSAKEPLPKKRRRSRRRSEGEPNKRSRQSAGRSPRSSAHNGCPASDSDDMSESSTAGCVLENSLSSRSPRPSKYNFYVELDPELDCSQRIALLQQKLQELRKTYMNIKAELACIDRRRKKLRRREREEKATKQEVTCS